MEISEAKMRDLLKEINDNVSALRTEITGMREDLIRLQMRIGTTGSGGIVDDLSRLEGQFDASIKKLEIEVDKLKEQVDEIKQKVWKWAGGLALAIFLSGFIGLVVSILRG